MKSLVGLLNILCALALTNSAVAQTVASNATPRQNAEELRQTVEHFLQKQSTGLPGEISIATNPVDSRLNLPACASPEAFLPPGGRLWGKTTVGVRCNAPASWTIYLTATVRVVGEYIAAAVPLAQGQQIGPQDIITIKGDLTSLPQSIITDPAIAIGRTATRSLQAGTPLRQDTLRAQRAVQSGQIVKIISSGPGFRVAAEGKALTTATEGQIVQVAAANGQVVSGIAKVNGTVEVTY